MAAARFPRFALLAPLAGLLLLASQQAAATFAPALNLVQRNPDLYNAGLSGIPLTYTYNAGDGTGVLQMTLTGGQSFGTLTRTDASVVSIDAMDYMLTLNLTNAGGTLSTGTLSIVNQGPSTPNIGLGIGEVLLAGNVFRFGVLDQGADSGTFEVELTSTAASSKLGFGVGETFGLLFIAGNISAATWNAGNVDFTAEGSSDAFPTPAPATLALLAAGLLGIGAHRARRG